LGEKKKNNKVEEGEGGGGGGYVKEVKIFFFEINKFGGKI